MGDWTPTVGPRASGGGFCDIHMGRARRWQGCGFLGDDFRAREQATGLPKRKQTHARAPADSSARGLVAHAPPSHQVLAGRVRANVRGVVGNPRVRVLVWVGLQKNEQTRCESRFRLSFRGQ